MFRNILVAVDGSEHSDTAFEVAADVAQRYRAKLMVLYAFPGSTGTGTIVSGDAEDASKLEGYGIIKSYEGKLVGKDLTGTQFFLQKGDAAESILRTAGSESVDLIVIGRRGVGRIEALVLGSVSRKVANDAKCNVLIVR